MEPWQTHVARYELAADGPLREQYLVGPLDTSDESAWRTEIGWPIVMVAEASSLVFPWQVFHGAVRGYHGHAEPDDRRLRVAHASAPRRSTPDHDPCL